MKLTPKKIGSLLSNMALKSSNESEVKKGVKMIAETIVRLGKTAKLGTIIDSFNKKYNEEAGIVDVVAIVSNEHTVIDIKELGKKKVALRKVVDPKILGGVKIETEDFLIDNSLSGKIKALKQVK